MAWIWYKHLCISEPTAFQFIGMLDASVLYYIDKKKKKILFTSLPCGIISVDWDIKFWLGPCIEINVEVTATNWNFVSFQ